MNIKKIVVHLSLLLVVTAHSATFCKVLITNKSAFNLKYKFAEPNTIDREFILLPEHSVTALTNEPFSIRRSGKGASYISWWYELPLDQLEKEYIKKNPLKDFRYGWVNISISSGLAGWNTTLEKDLIPYDDDTIKWE